MKKLILSLTIFLSVFFSAVPVTFACSCIVPGTPQEEMENSDAVFVGTVTNVSSSSTYGYDVEMSVEQSYKGVESTTVSLHTGTGGGDCGFYFEEGKTYIVYATLVEDTLEVYICSLTGLAEDADFEGLGEALPLSEHSGMPTWVYGAGTAVILLATLAYTIKRKK